MESLPTFVVAGIPLIIVVFALIEEIKTYGLSGKILRLVSLVLGLILALAYQVTVLGLPINAAEWFKVVIVGLLYGLTASGAYDFLDGRFPIK